MALGAGTPQAARSSEPDPDATATCAAVIKVGRPCAASHAFLVCALCVCCVSPLQHPGRDAGSGRAAGSWRGAGDLASSPSA